MAAVQVKQGNSTIAHRRSGLALNWISRILLALAGVGVLYWLVLKAADNPDVFFRTWGAAGAGTFALPAATAGTMLIKK